MKLTENFKMMTLAGLLVVGAGAASARGDQAERFAAVDADGNGEITQAEIKAHGEARFKAADTDEDGFLSAQELAEQASKRRANRAQKMIKHLDANEDGKLEMSEMTARRDPAKMFERLDKDGNGSLSAAEFEKAGKHGRGHKRHHDKHDHKPASE